MSGRWFEIDGDDARWLRGQLPDGVEMHDRVEVDFMGRTYAERPSGLLVPEDMETVDDWLARKLDEAEPLEPEPRPIGVDLFCGAGGFSLGMHEAGFDVLGAAEWDVHAAHTYLLNLAAPDCEIRTMGEKATLKWETHLKGSYGPKEGGWIGSGYLAKRDQLERGCKAFWLGDVRDLTGAEVLDAVGGDVGCVFGGPPCQGLSSANANACIEDPRNAMLWEFMRLVGEIRPRSFMIENVTGLLTVAKGALFEALARTANEHGYNVVAQKLDAASYGVPQYRLRAIVVGTLDGVPTYRYPMPTHWAVGRPIEGDGWAIGAGVRGIEAEFDEETGRWSAPDEEPEDEAEEQLGLL